MDFYILNQKFEIVSILDDYKSFIWTDRYSSYGDFEVYIPEESSNITYVVLGNYVYSQDSDHLMIIDSITSEEDAEFGNYIKATGKSLESILDRRIVWEQTNLEGSLESQIEKLIKDNIVSPSDLSRRIENFVFKKTENEYISSLTIEAQFTGDSLYSAIKTLCDSVQIGFKITLSENNEFIFELYNGTDRSYKQETLPYVVFSPFFENLLDNTFLKSDRNFKNIALVAGEGEGKSRKTVVVGNVDAAGLSRRELYVDARDISSNDGTTTLTPVKYNALLTERGNERLKEYKIDNVFDGEIETTLLYQYKIDFFMGDIVQLEDRRKNSSAARITEFIYSYDSSKISKYPTLTIIEDEEVEE